MPDRIFYPFAFICVAAMVVLAIFWDVMRNGSSMGPDPLIEGFVLEGEGLRALVPGPGTSIDFSGEVPVLAIASAHMSRDLAPPSAGLFGYLNPVFEGAFGEKNIEFTVRARAAAETPSETFSMVYFTGDVGSSERQSFQLTSEFADYTVSYKPASPLEGRKNPGDFAGIWPDESGKGGAMEIERLSVRVMR